MTSDNRPGRSLWSTLVAACSSALVLTITGCSDEPVEAEAPESIAVTASPGALGNGRLTGKPVGRWVRGGESIALTLFGSSSCPPVPTRLETDVSGNRITMTVSEDYGGVCTADLAPYTSVVELDEPMNTDRPIELIIRQSDHEDVRLVLR